MLKTIKNPFTFSVFNKCLSCLYRNLKCDLSFGPGAIEFETPAIGGFQIPSIVHFLFSYNVSNNSHWQCCWHSLTLS